MRLDYAVFLIAQHPVVVALTNEGSLALDILESLPQHVVSVEVVKVFVVLFVPVLQIVGFCPRYHFHYRCWNYRMNLYPLMTYHWIHLDAPPE